MVALGANFFQALVVRKGQIMSMDDLNGSELSDQVIAAATQTRQIPQFATELAWLDTLCSAV